jgi:hypothetical protein
MALATLEETREDIATKPSFMGIREGVNALGQGVLPKSNLRKKKGKKSKAKRKTKKKDCGCK